MSWKDKITLTFTVVIPTFHETKKSVFTGGYQDESSQDRHPDGGINRTVRPGRQNAGRQPGNDFRLYPGFGDEFRLLLVQ